MTQEGIGRALGRTVVGLRPVAGGDLNDAYAAVLDDGADGRPWLIDPAAHGGHREVDLAMLALFGGGYVASAEAAALRYA